MWHNTGRHAGPFIADAAGWLEPDIRHTENADTKRRFRNLLDVTGLLDQLDPRRPAPRDRRGAHALPHAASTSSTSSSMSAGMGGEGVDGTTIVARGSYEVALLAAGGVIAAVDAVLDGTVENIYALTRPAGHHAMPDAAIGFCLFGNAAIAVHHARAGPRPRARRRRRLGRPPRQRHPGRLLRRPVAC